MKKTFVLFLIFFIQSCAAVNVRTDDKPEDYSDPSFQKRYNYWWWGLRGEYQINVREICITSPVEQMQTVETPGDILLQIVTLGIYWPRTARVWCGETKS